MGDHNLNRREYGARYYETRTITELDVLAERILADVPSLLPADAVPTIVEFGIQIVANVLLRLQVGGLPDEFIFADRISQLHSLRAIDLLGQLTRIMESYNWTNAGELTDRRFFCSVYLLSEADYHSAFWTPGVVRVL
jgi:hypothetical protein